MPILVDSNHPSPRARGFYEGSSRCISIGFINNMPDSALEATERQFTTLLTAASDGLQVRLTRYMLPDVPRQEAARNYLNSCYTSVDDLWDRHLDGLLVPGGEPLTPNRADDLYGKSFVRVVEWAQRN